MSARGSGWPLMACGHSASGRVVTVHEVQSWWVRLWTEVADDGRRSIRELDLRPARRLPEIEELLVEARARWRRWDGGDDDDVITDGGLAASTLRDLALGALFQEQQRVVVVNTEPPFQPTTDDETSSEPSFVSREEARLLPLLRAAEAYVRLVRSGDRSPAKTWADQEGVPVRTVQDQIARARAAGLLTAARPGEVGGKLTPTAADLRDRLRRLPRI